MRLLKVKDPEKMDYKTFAKSLGMTSQSGGYSGSVEDYRMIRRLLHSLEN